MKKYELTNETKVICGRTLYRIKALISFENVSEGDLGGFIEKESNLSHDGNAWVYGNAWAYGNARVCDNAWVCDNARVCGNAWVCGDAEVYGNADYIFIKGLGSEYRVTTAFRNKSKGISVRCGCFLGTLQEFEDKVKETHRESKFAKEYLALVELIKIHFETEETENEEN